MDRANCRFWLKKLIEALEDLIHSEAERHTMWHMCYEHKDKLACDQMKESKREAEDAARIIKESISELSKCLGWG